MGSGWYLTTHSHQKGAQHHSSQKIHIVQIDRIVLFTHLIQSHEVAATGSNKSIHCCGGAGFGVPRATPRSGRLGDHHGKPRQTPGGRNPGGQLRLAVKGGLRHPFCNLESVAQLR
jgi:hypothetical protein